MERYCDEDCNKCKVLLTKNFKQVYYALARLEHINSELVQGEINSVCPNLTVCPECRVDDFCHTEGCEIAERLEKEFG